MIRTVAAFAIAVLLPLAPAAAQDPDAALDLGGDAYRSGGSVLFAEEGAQDVFLAGERVELEAPIAGSAHLAGRRVEVTGAVGGDLYAMAGNLRVASPVTGTASLAAYDLALVADVAGNLRATGGHVDLAGAVGGSALIAGRDVVIGGVIAGDVELTAESLFFGEGARIDGRLTLYEAEGAPLAVPASVAPPERIERRELEDDAMMPRMDGPEWFVVAAGLVLGALVLAALATVAAMVAPVGMSQLRAIVAEGPFRTLGAGFVTQAALIGGAVLLAITVIGVFLAPFAILAAVVLGIVGYVVAIYLVGVWAITRAGALEPDTFPEYALAALVGALIAGVLTLIPFLGWLVLLALSLTGVGAIATATLRPSYGRFR